MAYYPTPAFEGDGSFEIKKPIISTPMGKGTITFPIKQFTKNIICIVKVGVKKQNNILV